MDRNAELLAALAVKLNLLRVALHRAHRAHQEAGSGKRKRRFGVHPLWRNRETEGELGLFRQMLMDDEQKFYGYFRMSRNCFTNLLRRIEDQLVKVRTHWKIPISPEERLAVCLRYLATGDSLKTISFSFRMGHATAHCIVKETCKAIIGTLLQETIPVPSTEMLETVRNKFWKKFKFPNCIGAIGGKHVSIQAPGNAGLGIIAVADTSFNFIAVEIGTYGKDSEGGVFSQSNLWKCICDGTFQMLPDTNFPGTSICAPNVIVADEAFPLKRNLLRPYPASQAEEYDDRKYFNTRLAAARRVVETAFGILSQKFRIFERRVQAKPENFDYVIMTTCVLHNYIRAYEGNRYTGQTDSALWSEMCHQGGNATRESFAIRDRFKDFLFQAKDSHIGATYNIRALLTK